MNLIQYLTGPYLAKLLQQTVDETDMKLRESTTELDRQCPSKQYAARELAMMRFRKGRPTIASVVAPAQSIPNSSPTRLDLNVENIGKLKVGKQRVWDERDAEHFQNLFNQLGNRPELRAALEETYMTTMAELTEAIYQRGLMISMQIQTSGMAVFTDPLTDYEVSIDYSDRTYPQLFPADLAGGALWSADATATGLEDLKQHAEAWSEAFLEPPAEVTMKRAQLRQLAEQVSTKEIFLARRGAENPSTTMIEKQWLTDDEMVELVQVYTRAARVTVLGATPQSGHTYLEEVKNGLPVERSFLPDDSYYFSAANNVERAWVPTHEKNFAPGIYTLSETKEQAPRLDRTVAVACMIPLVLDARKLAARKVA